MINSFPNQTSLKPRGSSFSFPVNRDLVNRASPRAVERIEATHPALMDRTSREAHGEALESLGLTALHAELATIKSEEESLARREKRAQRAMLAAIRGMPIEEVSDSFSVRYGSELPLPYEVADAIVKRQSAHRDRLLADDSIGRDIARLHVEKEGLLDIV